MSELEFLKPQVSHVIDNIHLMEASEINDLIFSLLKIAHTEGHISGLKSAMEKLKSKQNAVIESITNE